MLEWRPRLLALLVLVALLALTLAGGFSDYASLASYWEW
jgi:hypothetical protein